MSEIVLEERAATPPAAPGKKAKRANDFLYYGLRNKKLVFGLGLELLILLLAIIRPTIANRTKRSSRLRPKISFLFRSP